MIPMTNRSKAIAAALALCLLGGVLALLLRVCGDAHDTGLATLTDAAGGAVDRNAGTAAWKGAPVGTSFFLGDSARTADGTAQLRLNNGAMLKMQPHTVLHFGAVAGRSRLEVQLGAVEVAGKGSYDLDFGKLQLGESGGVRIVGGPGHAQIELLLGTGHLESADGAVTDLVVGRTFTLDLGRGVIEPTVDAGIVAVPIAAIDSGVQAQPIMVASLTVVGKKAQLQANGEKNWAALPAGDSEQPVGNVVRVGAATTVHATAPDAPGVVVDVAAGSLLAISPTPMLSMRNGHAAAATNGNPTGGPVGLPGGRVTVPGGSSKSFDVDGKGTATIAATRGGIAIDGITGQHAQLQRGESARLRSDGTIEIIENIPDYLDVLVQAGESFTIHDPKKAAASVRFDFTGKCPSGGVVEMSRDGSFVQPHTSAASAAANLLVPIGTWQYRVRCSHGSTDGEKVAAGRVTVERDDGRRPLPAKPSKNVIDADGRNYRVVYQTLIPVMEFQWHGATGNAFTLHIATKGGRPQVIQSSTPTVTMADSKLNDGDYTYWFEKGDGSQRTKDSTLTIEFDNAAPSGYIEAPTDGQAWPSSIGVRGIALPGWTANVDGQDLPVDNQGRFSGTVPAPHANAVAIRLANAQRGVHYYLRRQ